MIFSNFWKRMHDTFVYFLPYFFHLHLKPKIKAFGSISIYNLKTVEYHVQKVLYKIDSKALDFSRCTIYIRECNTSIVFQSH